MKSRPIEDYGFIGNLVTGALVSRGGSIDWLCLPGFSSDACFAALLGTPENGSWSLRPVSQIVNVRRRYIPQTLVLETIFETPEGIVKIVDFMSLKATETTGEVIRLVKGLAGTVAMAMELIIRFGYGRIVPWVQRRDFGLRAIAGPDCIDFVTSAPLHNDNLRTESKFVVKEGDEVPFSLSYHPSNTDGNFIDDRNVVLRSTVDWWQQWSARPTTDETKALANDHWHQAVLRSQLTLKALTYRPTGSIVAAPTTSLPEELGGRRNWDYRFCWIRDATLTLYALLNSGHIQEAVDFRIWLVRAAAGQPEQLQIMYGLA